VDAAENAWEPRDDQVVLAHVPPHLLAREGAGGEALEVFGFTKRASRQKLGGELVVPLLGLHGVEILPGRILSQPDSI
jgi:hypothetical protein